MATTLLSLPLEIQRQCVNYLDTAALKSTRLTSQALKDIATEALFQVATLQFTKKSAGQFTALIKNDEIRRYIRQVSMGMRGRLTASHVVLEEADNFSSTWKLDVTTNVQTTNAA